MVVAAQRTNDRKGRKQLLSPEPPPRQTPQATAPVSASASPLSGLLVADFSRVLAGPYATQLLGDLGADVVKVESPVGDETRGWLPPERDGISTYYLGVNRNKSAISLDFRNADDRAVATELAQRADIVVENFKPGTLVKYRLDYDSVARHNPSVLYASISGFGSAAGASLPGYDLIVQAVSGLMSITGPADGPAYRSGVSVFDVMTGMQAVVGILAALNHRTRTGDGQHIEVNLLSTALSAMANHSSTFVAGGIVPYRMGNAHPSLFPYESFAARDGEIVVVAATDAQFVRLATALGRPEWAEEPDFAVTERRNRNRDRLRPLLEERLATRTVDEWSTILTAAGVACGPVNTIDDGIALAERLGLDPVVAVGEGERQVPMIRNPIRLSRTPARYASPPPIWNEHGEAIREWLSADRDAPAPS